MLTLCVADLHQRHGLIRLLFYWDMQTMKQYSRFKFKFQLSFIATMEHWPSSFHFSSKIDFNIQKNLDKANIYI